MEWTQLKVVCKTEELDSVCAVVSVIDSALMIEDYSDIEENLMTVYGELIDEAILNADKSRAAVSIYVPEEKSVADLIILRCDLRNTGNRMDGSINKVLEMLTERNRIRRLLGLSLCLRLGLCRYGLLGSYGSCCRLGSGLSCRLRCRCCNGSSCYRCSYGCCNRLRLGCRLSCRS